METRLRAGRRGALVLAVGFAAAAFAQEGEPPEAKGRQVDETGKGYSAAYVVDAGSGRPLLQENADEMLPVASMAKMMTCLIAMEQVQQGKLSLDQPIPISARAAGMGGSQIYAKQGQSFPLKTLLAAAMIQSANDAAAAIAEAIAGSDEAFAERMNARAKQMGLAHSVFYDPHGLPNAQDPEHVDKMSARDLAVLGAALMKHPLMREYAKAPHWDFQNGTFTAGLTNPNHLVQPGKRDYYQWATGIKTGYSGPAGFCVTASAEKGGRQLIAVVMGARARYGPRSSFAIAAKLFADAFARS